MVWVENKFDKSIILTFIFQTKNYYNNNTAVQLTAGNAINMN